MRSLLSLGRVVHAYAGQHHRVTAGRAKAAIRAGMAGLVVAVATLSLICLDASAAVAAPLIGRTWSSHVGVHEATLNAKVNPMGFATTYRFEYGQSTEYGSAVPAGEAAAGAGSVEVAVSQIAGGLQPGSVYHYRIAATNQEGTTYGPDKTVKTYPLTLAETDNCPNAATRTIQFSSYLPDCRAYEMASPLQKNGGNIAADPKQTISSPDGNAVKYTSTTLFGDVQGAESRGAEYVSSRASDGWVTHGINPNQESEAFPEVFSGSQYEYFSEDLTKGVYLAFKPLATGHPNVETVPNLYLRTDVLSGPSGDYELLSDSVNPLARRFTVFEPGIAFDAASADFKHILFETTADLTTDSLETNPGLPKAYEWHDGQVSLVGILPNGKPAEGSCAGSCRLEEELMWTRNTISADGSRIVFTAAPFGKLQSFTAGRMGRLYMRIDGRETVQINASELPVPEAPRPAQFWAATPDDSKIFFTTPERLTPDASTSSGGFLYEYSADAASGKRLTLIASNLPGQGAPSPVLAVSTDGTYVYFMENQKLNPGDPGDSRTKEVYVWHDGVVHFVTTHEAFQETIVISEGWGDGPSTDGNAFRLTPDGRTAVFSDKSPVTAELAGYENPPYERSPSENRGYNEVYVYHYGQSGLECASCNPSSAAAVSHAGFTNRVGIDWDALFLTSYSYFSTIYLNHPVSDDGRFVFFDTIDALVPQDVNGKRDVYEYDTLTKTVHLISDGRCDCNSFFVDASRDGSNVFFTTYQKFVASDTDNESDLYDARIGGGIASQNVAAPVPCGGDDCQGPASQAPGFSLPSSLTFAGVGNPASVASTVQGTVMHRAHVKRKAKRRRKRRRKGRKAARVVSGRVR